MKISYGITVYNEAEELKRLFEVLYKNIDDTDEVVVCVDGDDDAVRFELDVYTKKFSDSYKPVKVYNRKLKKDFAAQKNSVIENSTGDYVSSMFLYKEWNNNTYKNGVGELQKKVG